MFNWFDFCFCCCDTFAFVMAGFVLSFLVGKLMRRRIETIFRVKETVVRRYLVLSIDVYYLFVFVFYSPVSFSIRMAKIFWLQYKNVLWILWESVDYIASKVWISRWQKLWNLFIETSFSNFSCIKQPQLFNETTHSIRRFIEVLMLFILHTHSCSVYNEFVRGM